MLHFLDVRMWNLRINNIWTYAANSWLLLTIYQMYLVIAKLDSRCSTKDELVHTRYVREPEVTILHKSGIWRDLPCVFLSDFLISCQHRIGQHDEPDISFMNDSNDYFLKNIAEENTDYLVKDYLFVSPVSFASHILANILLRIKLSYPLRLIENGVKCFSETEEQREHNTNLCFFLVESIFIWVYKSLAIRYYLKDEEFKCKNTLDEILKNMEFIFKGIFLFHPTIMAYTKNIKNLEAKLKNSKRLQDWKYEIQYWLCYEEVILKDKEKHDNINQNLHLECYQQNSEAISILKKLQNILDDHIKAHKAIITLVWDQRNDLSCRITKARKMFNKKINDISKEVKNYEDKKKRDKDTSAFLKRPFIEFRCCLTYETLQTEKMEFMKRFQQLDNDIFNNIWECYETSLRSFEEYWNDVVWTPQLINASYIVETAKIIETNSELSMAISLAIVKYVSIDNINLNGKIIKKYVYSFPGLVKSICDSAPEYWNRNRDTVSVSVALRNLFAKKWNFMIFVDLYFAVRKENLQATEVNAHISDLLYKLKRVGIVSFAILKRQKLPYVTKILYAIHILEFSESKYKSTHEDFFRKFRAALHFLSGF